MKINVPTILFTGVGLLLIWSGVTNRSPTAVVRAVLSGQPIPGPGSIGKAIGEAAKEAGKRAVENIPR